MPLSNEQIHQIVESKPKKNLLLKAVNHEQRLRFHTETILQKTDLGQPWANFKKWLGSEAPVILERGKVARIDQLIQTPIQTVELSESIFSRLHRIFHPQDGFFNYEFKDSALKEDWQEFKDKTFWRTKGFEAMQSAINSVWVVDLPEGEMKTEQPEPVNRLIRIEDVIDIEVDDSNNCKWLIFQDGDVVYAYDSEYIRAYRFDDRLSAQPESEIAHGLGYAPARMFWSEKLEMADYINKESPITKELSDFDWLLFHMAAKKYMDLANSFPILVSYNMEGGYDDDSITRQDGPEGGSSLGPGTEIEVDAPKTNDDPDLMSNPIKYINPDVATLEWHVKEEIRLTNKIFKSVVGVDQEQRSESAKNELQVGSAYESQVSVLLRIKQNFEVINSFADKTICKLRYGDSFIGCTVDYGTKFFLKSEEDLYGDYKSAKDSGADDVVLSEITGAILDTRFRDDNAGRTRASIIGDLDPLPEKTTKEATEILNSGGIDKLHFIIKMNLLNFVKRFERENLPLNLWGGKKEYADIINDINKKFIDYAKERSSQEDQP